MRSIASSAVFTAVSKPMEKSVPGHVVIDGARNDHHLDVAFLGQRARTLQASVATDHHQAADAVIAKILDRMSAPGRSAELIRTRGLQDGSATLNDIGDRAARAAE